MRRFFAPACLVVLIPFLTAMSFLQGDCTDKIPVPDRKFQATFVDQMDITTECVDVTIDGCTFLEGKKGEGTYTIPFSRIRSITFRNSGGNLQGIARLDDGSDVGLALKRDRKAFGKTKYGTFQISLTQLKRMVIRQAPEKKG